jgi:serine/threonine protein kinase
MAVSGKDCKEATSLFDHKGACLQPRTLENMINEILMLNNEPLFNHENIVTVSSIAWYYNQLSDMPSAQPMVMIRTPDFTLREFLDQNPEPPPFKTRVAFCLHISTAVATLHARNIIHSNVQLDNVLIYATESQNAGLPQYTAKLMGFGDAFLDNGRYTSITRDDNDFTAPEIVVGETIHNMKALDIYSVGVVIWNLLVQPFLPPVLTEEAYGPLLAGSEDDIAMLLYIIRQRFEGDDNMVTFYLNEITRNSIRSAPTARNLQVVIHTLQRLLGLPDVDPIEYVSCNLWIQLNKSS